MNDDLDIKSWLLKFEIAVLHIECKYHDSWDLVVYDASSSYKISLKTDQLTIENVDSTQLICREREVYDILVARKKVLNRFLENALHADSSTENRDAAWCYRQIARKNDLIARLEMLKFYYLFETTFSTFSIQSTVCWWSLDLFSYASRSLCMKRSHHLLEHAERLWVFCRSWAYSTRSENLMSTDHEWCKTSTWAFLVLSSSNHQSKESRRSRTANTLVASRTVLRLWRRFDTWSKQIQFRLNRSYIVEQLDFLWSCLWSSNVYRAAIRYMQSLWTTKSSLKIANFCQDHRSQSNSLDNSQRCSEMKLKSQ